jgi:hypothetical protein
MGEEVGGFKVALHSLVEKCAEVPPVVSKRSLGPGSMRT